MNVYENSGADPGIFVRGVQLSEIFDKQKKKKGGGELEKRRVVVALSLLAEEWFKSIFQTSICIQVRFRGRAWQVPLYTNTQMTW